MQLGEMMRANFQKITDHLIEIETDGINVVPEMKWGKYLVTFEHDHLEVVGFNPKVKPHHVASLVIDNLRVHDQHRFGDSKKRGK